MRFVLFPSIFSTLVRKNFQKQRNHKLIFFVGLIVPVLSALILLISRYSNTPNTPHFTTKADDSLSFDSSWSLLIQKINARRERMLKAQKNFYANVFIPNLRVAFAPSSHVGLQKLMERALGKLDISKNRTHGFIDCDHMRTRAPFEQFIASVCFHNEDVDDSKNGLPQVLHYSIIMPSELRNYEQTSIGQCWTLGTSQVVPKVLEPSAKVVDDGYSEYLQEGFMALQYYISTEYIKMASGSASVKSPVTNLRALDGAHDANSIFGGDSVTAIILTMVLGFMFPVTLLVKFIVEEYETGQRFVLELNNVSRFVQVAAWFVNACLQLLLTSCVITLILKISWNGAWAPLNQCPLLIMLIFFVSYSLSVGSFIILISAIIRSTKLALLIVPIVWFLVQMPFLFHEQLKSDLSNAFNMVASVFLCNVALSWGLTHLMDMEDHPGVIPVMDVLTSGADQHFELSLGGLIVFFYIQTLMYILLTLIIMSRTMARIVDFLRAVSLLKYLLRSCRCRRKRRKLEASLVQFSVVVEDNSPVSSQQNVEDNTKKEEEKKKAKNRWFSSYWNSSSHKNPPRQDSDADRDIENDTETETEAEPEAKPERKGWNLGWLRKYWPSSPPQEPATDPFLDSEAEIETREAVIEFRNVSKKFRKNYVIKRLTLTVFQGEVVVLLGHNSSGKTTIMRMICGQTLPTRGRIYLSGVNIVQHGSHLNLKAYRKVGISLSPSALISEFTVFDHLMFFCTLRGLKRPEADREVRAFLRSMQMEDVQETRVGNLCMGQKRIFQSLCAFAGRTEIVLLGKPLDGVDEARARLFYNFVQAEKRNRTIFVTTNRSSVASGLGDRIAIVSKGSLVFLGSERKMCHELNDAYRLTFYGKAQCDFEKVRQFLETVTAAGVELESKMGDSAVFLIKKQDVPQLTKALETLPSNKEELKIDSFHLQECSLDRLLIKHFTPELQHFALQAPEAEPSTHIAKWSAMKRFCLMFSHFKIVLRHRALIDIGGSFFLMLKVFLPTLVAIWMALCVPYLHSYRKLLEKSAFPVDDRVPVAVTLAQEGLSMNDGPLRSAYNKYVAMGAKKVDADLDITNMRNTRGSENNVLSQDKILATAKFTRSEVDAQFNNYWRNTAPHSLALVMNALAVGYVGADSGIQVNLDPLPYSTVPAVQLNSEKYNITLLFMSSVCFAFCYIWTLPMLFMTLDRDSRLNYIELIAGMQTRVLLLAILVYELIVFVISFLALHLAIMVLRIDALMDTRGFLLYGNAMMVVAMCVLSINLLVSLGSADVHTAYLAVLAFHTLGIVTNIFVSQLNVTGAKRILFIFLDFYPVYTLMENMMRIINILNTRWLCEDVQIFETSVYAEECKIQPNCCDNNAKEYSHFRYIICIYLLSLVVWFLIYARLKSQLYKSRPQQGKYFWDSDADSYYEQHVLHMAQPSDVENTWIFEKSRVRTLERSLIWMKTIHVEDLSVLFGVKVALGKVDFMVDRYQVLSLFGANGSGKTVMIKAILGIYSPSSGKVSGVNRIPYQRTKPAIGNLAGYSAQEVNMMQELTVLETLKLVLRLRRRQKGKALREEAILLCKILNLYQFRYHFLASLSQGVLKRLSIGLALMTHAELILLDDPFANLDVITQHAVLQSIQDACRHGHCVIYTCSHTDFLAPAQRLAALGAHGFVAIGERQEITRNYYTSYYVIDTRVYLPELQAMNARRPEGAAANADPEVQNKRRARRNYLKVSAFVEKIFPAAIIKSVTYPSTCFWLSSQKYPISQIFQAFERNKKTFYSYSISQPSVGAIYLHITPEQVDNNEFGY